MIVDATVEGAYEWLVDQIICDRLFKWNILALYPPTEVLARVIIIELKLP